MMNGKRTAQALLVLLWLFQGCGNGEPEVPEKNMAYDDVKDSLIMENKELAEVEEEDIENYIERRGWEMKKTPTGLRYMVVEQGEGKQAERGMVAQVEYELSLLNGEVCYTSDSTGPKTFMIGKDDVETGLHQGIQFLREGGKAVFIMPTHLAHGLFGDYKKIPINSSIVYEIELLRVQKPQSSP